jgi:hypothetical protein
VATKRKARKGITEKTRQADERLREELRNADIGKLKRLMTPLIEKKDAALPTSDKSQRPKTR